MSTDLSHVRLGTSSWAYEGWQGLVYQQTYPKSRFSQDTLTEYASFEMDGIPLFRTVGIDHSFYRPASAAQLAHYARQVPEDFRFCSKVWEEITIPAYANLPRYGAKAGKSNSRFLDIGAFRDLVWAPAQEGLARIFMTVRREMAEWCATCVTCEPCPYLSRFSRPSRLNLASAIAAEALMNNAGYDRNLVRSFLSFSAGASSLPSFLTGWTDFSAHCRQDDSTQ